MKYENFFCNKIDLFFLAIPKTFIFLKNYNRIGRFTFLFCNFTDIFQD